MLNKVTLYISVFVIILVTAFYIRNFLEINSKVEESQFQFDLPKITVIRNCECKGDLMRYVHVWTDYSSASVAYNAGKNRKGSSVEKEKVIYIFKEIKNIPAICKKNDKDYRWEFYGTVYERSSFKGIFYNPKLKKIVIIPSGYDLDYKLKLKSVDKDSAVVVYDNNTFNLKIFNFKNQKRRKNK